MQIANKPLAKPKPAHQTGHAREVRKDGMPAQIDSGMPHAQHHAANCQDTEQQAQTAVARCCNIKSNLQEHSRSH